MVKDFGRRLPMDTRMVSEISRSSKMSQEQGVGILSEWGGSDVYQFWAKQPVSHRLTYFAVQEGYTTAADIAAVTDLKKSEVTRALTALDEKGLVTLGVVQQ